ncbi:NUDIX hydrolase [Mesorhizobium sp. NBSH29]|uniref:NUDIX hydrolase n=1 Tax=Mesorhizobium sp. NBSH29 TaxID=2654249 RepID=UPI00189681A0|nr:NUDIX hydrolase [Mesorhizobium sp. NBSH29]QPC88701.1 NUDIX hydrolase [Mesorhizobium sp. NBSH29]
MEGMTRAEIDRDESRDFAFVGKQLRPRDAATLILLDRVGSGFHVLMGRRHKRHAFMPGKFVFPGGRTDPDDGRIPVMQPLHPDEAAKLASRGKKISDRRVRAIALSALRETYEEAGLLIGHSQPFQTDMADWQGFAEHRVHPSLETLRLVARAITPPRRVRRFDTWFFAAWRSDVAVALPDGGPTEELEELVWLPIDKARKMDIPRVTQTVLADIEKRLEHDPLLRPGGDVPFYHMVRNRIVRDIL